MGVVLKSCLTPNNLLMGLVKSERVAQGACFLVKEMITKRMIESSKDVVVAFLLKGLEAWN